MENWKTQAEERRGNERFRAQKGIYIVVGPLTTQKCQMLDINKTGLSFRYFVGAKKIQPLGEDAPAQLHIYVSTEDFYLEAIPFTTVYDVPLQKEIPIESVALRRRGVKFGKLTPKQRLKLDTFIGSHTTRQAQAL